MSKKKNLLDGLSNIPETIFKFADQYWKYWWVVLAGIFALFIYLIFFTR